MLSLLWFLILSIVCYEFCNSRTAIIGVFLIVVAAVFLKQRKTDFFKNLPVYAIGKCLVVFVLLFSIIPPILRNKGILMPLWYKFDAVFTNRTLAGAAAIEGYGIHFLHFMNTDEYRNTLVWIGGISQHGIVLDNGYVYILIRYGVLAVLLLIQVWFGLYKHYRNNVFAISVITAVLCVNFLDNDFLSYGFLPYMIIGIRNMKFLFVKS